MTGEKKSRQTQEQNNVSTTLLRKIVKIHKIHFLNIYEEHPIHYLTGKRKRKKK